MSPISRIPFLFLAALLAVYLFTPCADASKPIAQVYSFQGEVIVQSGAEIFRLIQPELPLKDGDRIQTKQGRATINFEDGAVMKRLDWRVERSGLGGGPMKKSAARTRRF